MKKAISILLALILCAVSCCAFADTLEVQAGTPLNCTFDEFKTQYDTYGGSQLPVTWEDGSTADGEYEVYTGKAKDGEIEVKVYTIGGKVCYMMGTGSKTVNMTNSSDAKALGEDIGMVLGLGDMVVYFADGGEYTSDLLSTFTNDLQTIVTSLTGGLSDYTKMKNGIAVAGQALGYPTGLELSSTGEVTSAAITWKLIITSKDSKLNVK